MKTHSRYTATRAHLRDQRRWSPSQPSTCRPAAVDHIGIRAGSGRPVVGAYKDVVVWRKAVANDAIGDHFDLVHSGRRSRACPCLCHARDLGGLRSAIAEPAQCARQRVAADVAGLAAAAEPAWDQVGGPHTLLARRRALRSRFRADDRSTWREGRGSLLGARRSMADAHHPRRALVREWRELPSAACAPKTPCSPPARLVPASLRATPPEADSPSGHKRGTGASLGTARTT